jgi:serine/threonine-protein kinase
MKTWELAYALPVEGSQRADVARAALAAWPADLQLPEPALIANTSATLTLGSTLRLTGNTDRAIVYLSAAAKTCDILDDVYTSVRAELHLADIYAQQGKVDDARRLYEQVVARWGNAKPRSVTADAARAGLAALAKGRSEPARP